MIFKNKIYMRVSEHPVFCALSKDGDRKMVLLILSVLILFINIGHAFRYSYPEKMWWFEYLNSCSDIIMTYTMSLMVIHSIRISLPEMNSVGSASCHKALAKAVVDKFFFGVAYLTCLSVILFPVLCWKGAHLHYLVVAYLYSIGFGSWCLLPLNVLWQIRDAKANTVFSVRNLLHFLLFIPVIGIFLIVEEFLDGQSTNIPVIILAVLSILGFLCYMPTLNFLLKRYEK